jgi:hypothetical protein
MRTLISCTWLSVLLIVTALSTLAGLLRFATQFDEDVSSIQKQFDVPQSTPLAEPQEMQGLIAMAGKVQDLVSPERLPPPSKELIKSLYVTQQLPGAAMKPGAARFVCLSDTHGLHMESSSSADKLKVRLPCGTLVYTIH